MIYRHINYLNKKKINQKNHKKYEHVHLSGKQSIIKDETQTLFTFATQTMLITGLVSFDQVSIAEYIHSLLH